jgi:hypothetical protein
MVQLGLGGFTTVAVPDGVIVDIGGGTQDEEFERLLELTVAALERRGVVGRLDLFDETAVEDLPLIAPLVECRLRVLGERYHVRGPQHYRWRADPDAWASLVRAGVEWCLEAEGEISLGVLAMPRAVLRAKDDAVQLLLSAFEGNEATVVDVASRGVDRVRVVAVEQWRYRISLIEAEEAIRPHGWRDAVGDMTVFVKRNSDLMVYALIKHGCNVLKAGVGSSLDNDWPPRPGFGAAVRHELEFEDEYAPDAFAIQLLGPGYAGRVPAGPSWRRTDLAHDRVILEHREPDLWFEQRFPRGRSRNSDQQERTPDVLASARADFTEILFKDTLAEEQP